MIRQLITILSEIKDLFFKQKRYLVLLIGLIGFYGVLIGMQANQTSETIAIESSMQNASADRKMDMSLSVTPDMFQAKLKEGSVLGWLLIAMTSCLLGGVFCGVWFITGDMARWRRQEEIIPSLRRQLNVTWGISELIKVILLFVLTATCLNVFIAGIKFLIFPDMSAYHMALYQSLIMDVAAIYLIARVIGKKGSRFFDIIGFHFKQIPLGEIWVGLRTYLSILPIFATLLVTILIIVNLIQYEPPPHPLVEVLMAEESLTPWMIGLMMLLACFVGPILEEVFFRGFLYPALKRYMGVTWAMSLSAGLFALAHHNLFSFFPIFFLGVVLAYLYEKRHNLLAPIALHLVHNLVFITYFFVMKSFLGL